MVLLPHVIEGFRSGLVKEYLRNYGLDYWKYMTIFDGIEWEWQSLDSVSVKAPLGGILTGPNPTDRGKLGTKRHVLADKKGIPLSVVITVQYS